MLSLRIAWRFLRSSPGQSALIIAGIAVGIAAQIFVGSLITSLQANLLDTTIGSAPQVTIQAIKEGDPVVYTARDAEARRRRPAREAGHRRAVRIVSSLYSNGTDSAPLDLNGGDLAELDGIYKLTDTHDRGRGLARQRRDHVGNDFAEKYGLAAGDTITLALPERPDRSTFTVTGIFDLGSAQFNERRRSCTGDVPQNVLGWVERRVLGDPDCSSTSRSPPRRSPRSGAQQLPGVSVVEWQGQNADLLTALQSQRRRAT